jgi:hypothetical protein
VFLISPSIEINRKIDLFKVDAVTLSQSTSSSEFIVHVKDEYDYRYQSSTLRDEIVHAVRKILKNKGHHIIFYKVVRVL